MNKVANLTIREATEDDAPDLRDYAARLFSEDLPGIFRRSAPTLEEEIAFIRSRTEPQNSTILVAEMDGAPVGLIEIDGESHPEQSHAGTFGASVDKSWRGRGVGGALLEELFNWATTHGITRIQGYVCETNARALTLYERHGFEREGMCRGAVVRDGRPIGVWLIARLLDHDEAIGDSDSQ